MANPKQPPNPSAEIFHAFENVVTTNNPKDLTDQILTNLDKLAPGVKAEALYGMALIELENLLMEGLANLTVIGGPKN
jgi:hypothetical protein